MSESGSRIMEFDDGASDINSKAEPLEVEAARNNESSSEEVVDAAAARRSANLDASSSRRRVKKQFAVSTRWEREVTEHGMPNDFHRYFCCCAQRLGNMFILMQWPDGSPIVIAGPCWPFCIGVTFPLVAGISALVIYFIFIDDDTLPSWVGYIYYTVAALALIALFCVSCRDPGLMERVTDEEAGQGGWFWNEQVGSFRPPGALYCRECGVMIQDYDHLCPWTGTGIGGGNMWAFKAFVAMVNILCYFSIILVAVVLLKGLAKR